MISNISWNDSMFVTVYRSVIEFRMSFEMSEARSWLLYGGLLLTRMWCVVFVFWICVDVLVLTTFNGDILILCFHTPHGCVWKLGYVTYTPKPCPFFGKPSHYFLLSSDCSCSNHYGSFIHMDYLYIYIYITDNHNQLYIHK